MSALRSRIPALLFAIVLVLGAGCGQTATVPVDSRRTGCNWNATVDPVFMGSIEQLAWTSTQVIVATVEERLPPVWGPDWRGDADQQAIYTDTRLTVDQPVRGTPLTSLLVRQPGGTIDSCAQRVVPTIDFAPGDRYLLFLLDPSTTGERPAVYRVTGSEQGAWRIGADGAVHVPNQNFQQYDGKPVADVAEAIRALLGAPPPDDPWAKNGAVPLEQAPIVSPAGTPGSAEP